MRNGEFYYATKFGIERVVTCPYHFKAKLMCSFAEYLKCFGYSNVRRFATVRQKV